MNVTANTKLGYDYKSACWEAARDEVKRFITLSRNWDGEDGAPVKAELIEPTLRLLDLAKEMDYQPPTYVYLTHSGTPMVEWHDASLVACANVRRPDRADVVYREAGVPPDMGYVSLLSETEVWVTLPDTEVWAVMPSGGGNLPFSQEAYLAS